MYEATKCPSCRATALIRTEQAGEYRPGECVNCRRDRGGELPGQPPGGDTALPMGVERIPGGRYRLPDGKIVKGWDAMMAGIQ